MHYFVLLLFGLFLFYLLILWPLRALLLCLQLSQSLNHLCQCATLHTHFSEGRRRGLLEYLLQGLQGMHLNLIIKVLKGIRLILRLARTVMMDRGAAKRRLLLLLLHYLLQSIKIVLQLIQLRNCIGGAKILISC